MANLKKQFLTVWQTVGDDAMDRTKKRGWPAFRDARRHIIEPDGQSDKVTTNCNVN